MRVLFLDIDGVLNDRDTLIAADSTDTATEAEAAIVGMDPCALLGDLRSISAEMVRHLNTLIERAKVDGVVISSSWRIGFSLQFIEAVLKHHGFKGTVIGKTPRSNPRDGSFRILRGWEIREWLVDHPEVTDFVILDDDSDMDDLPNFVHVNGSKGLTMNDIEQAVACFGV